MDEGTVRLRLVHDNAPPIHDTGEPYLFGLQTTKAEILPGVLLPDGGVVFDFELKVKSDPNSDRPVFSGSCVSGSAEDRFVYLSWKAANRAGFINRVKARLRTIAWDQVVEARQAQSRLVADLSGRKPHDTRPLDWTLA